MSRIGFTDRSGLPPKTEFADRDKPVVMVVGLVRETKDAVLVRDTAGVEAWLARKHLTIEDGISKLRITLPIWLAIDKGLRVPVDDDQKTLF